MGIYKLYGNAGGEMALAQSIIRIMTASKQTVKYYGRFGPKYKVDLPVELHVSSMSS